MSGRVYEAYWASYRNSSRGSKIGETAAWILFFESTGRDFHARLITYSVTQRVQRAVEIYIIRKELARSQFEPPTSWLETGRSATISVSVTLSLPFLQNHAGSRTLSLPSPTCCRHIAL